MLSKLSFLLNSKVNAFLSGAVIGAGVLHARNAADVIKEYSPEMMMPILSYFPSSPSTSFHPSQLWMSKFVNCSTWDYSTSAHDKFQKKHLMDGFDEKNAAGIVTYRPIANDAKGWNRTEYNRRMNQLMNHNPNNTPGFNRYGIMHRFTTIMNRSKEFNAPYNSTDLATRVYTDLNTEGLERNQRYSDPNIPFYPRHGDDVLYYPTKSTVIYGVWDKYSNSYDVYLIKDVFLLIGTSEHHRGWLSGRIPTHFEGFILSRPGEQDAFTLKQLNSTSQLQQRFKWSETLDKWFLRQSRCIKST